MNKKMKSSPVSKTQDVQEKPAQKATINYNVKADQKSTELKPRLKSFVSELTHQSHVDSLKDGEVPIHAIQKSVNSPSFFSDEKLYTALKELNIISEEVLDKSIKESKELKIPLEEILLKEDLIGDVALGRIIGDLNSVPFMNLSEVSIPDEILKIIPEEVARKQQVIAFQKDEKGLHVAINNPGNEQILKFLEKKVGTPVIVYYSPLGIIKKALSLYAKDVASAFDEIIKKSVDEIKVNKNAEPPIIKIVDTIIDYAYQNSASDIHIEPLEEEMLVRFRIDGVLHDIVKLSLELDTQIVTRVKVMANLRTDEHQEAQDGKIVYKTDGENLDIRVSIAPITKGEKIVMRLLSETSRQFSLSDLGLSSDDLKKVENAYHLPHGMILATGPTGSGKTTTLYAILKLINKRDVNIMTIEDPVEYQIDNVNQIQVNPKTDLTFAKGLRSIVRQDPDVILVGEIRDDEAADIAINSALTGHLVLSSLHTNNAVTAFPRLIDMNVEPYLVASTVNVVIAQRLVRKICSKCRFSQELPFDKIDDQVKKYLPKKTKLLIYQGKGCPVCHNTGYMGRIGLFEVLVMDEELNEAVVAKKSAPELEKIAIKNSMRTMLEDGIEKVKQGVTTLEEILRVTKE